MCGFSDFAIFYKTASSITARKCTLGGVHYDTCSPRWGQLAVASVFYIVSYLDLLFIRKKTLKDKEKPLLSSKKI